MVEQKPVATGFFSIVTGLAAWCRNLGFWVMTELSELGGVMTKRAPNVRDNERSARRQSTR